MGVSTGRAIVGPAVSGCCEGGVERQEPVITDCKERIRPSARGCHHPMLLGEPNVEYTVSVPSVCGYYLRLNGQLSVTIVCVLLMHCVLLECICLLDSVVGLFKFQFVYFVFVSVWYSRQD